MDGLRQRLLCVVTDVPGANTRQAATIVGVPESSADYHLRGLVKEGLLTTEFNGRTRHWFASGCGLCPVLRRAVPALRRPEARAVALALDDCPTTATDLSRRTGVALGGVRWAASVLEDARLVVRTTGGRLRLRHGARVCLGKATAGERCPQWGRCPVSQAFLAASGQLAWAGGHADDAAAGVDAGEEGYRRRPRAMSE